jgi:hypothetical protein
MTRFSLSRQRFGLPVLTAFIAAALLLVPGCGDPIVNVLKPSDQFQFSMFGVLDVAADTQVIRIEPLGDSTQIGAPRELDATVVLENLDNGEQIPLQDSVTTFGTRPTLVHNLWTTHPIQPATSYRVAVQRNGEPVTTATTTTPSQPPNLTHTAFPDTALTLPCVFPVNPNNQREAANTFTVTAQDIDRIASAKVIYPIPGEPDLGPAPDAFDHLKGVEKDEDLFKISVFYRPDLVDVNPNQPPPPRMQDECASRQDFSSPYALVAVAAGGPDWPEWRGLSLDEIARPDSFSNVQGGTGFVGGIYPDTVRVPLRERE